MIFTKLHSPDFEKAKHRLDPRFHHARDELEELTLLSKY